MAIDLKAYVSGASECAHSDPEKSVSRKGSRSALTNVHGSTTLAYFMSGHLPYFYRTPEKIGADFTAKHHATEMLFSIYSALPTTEKFQNSHFGEILAAVFLEHVLGYKKLYSKLTLTTAENTNVHKMDGFFVDTAIDPMKFLFVEAKTSIMPTAKSKFYGHRSGILKSMLESFGSYNFIDERFDLTRIRDNLDESFPSDVAKKIRAELVPPGPANAAFLGMAVVNSQTVCQEDDDFILTEPCSRNFDFAAITVDDLASLAKSAYGVGAAVVAAVKAAGAPS